MKNSFISAVCIIFAIQAGTAKGLPGIPLPDPAICKKLSAGSKLIGKLGPLEEITIPKIESLSTDIDGGYIAEDLVLTAEEWKLYGLNNMRFGDECPIEEGTVTVNIEYSQLMVELINYTLTGTLVQEIELFGNGSASVTLEDFKPTLMCTAFKDDDDNFQVDSVEIALPVQKFVVDFKGFMEGTDLQPVLNEFLSMEGQEILDTIAYILNKPPLNDALKALINFVLTAVQNFRENHVTFDPLVEKELVKRIDQIIEDLKMEITQ